jgi:hypothetical protein
MLYNLGFGRLYIGLGKGGGTGYNGGFLGGFDLGCGDGCVSSESRSGNYEAQGGDKSESFHRINPYVGLLFQSTVVGCHDPG